MPSDDEGGAVKVIDDALAFLTAPMNTDELKRQLEMLRDRMHAKAAEQGNLAARLDKVVLDLAAMDAKADFMLNLVGQQIDLFVPPEPEGLEVDYDRMKRTVYDPLTNAATIVGSVGAGIWLTGAVVLPATFKLVGFLARSGKVSGMAQSSRLLTMAKVGKVTVYVAIVAMIVEVALKIANAKKLNDYLREKRAELEEQVAECDRALARLETALALGTQRRADLLEGAGIEPDPKDGYTDRHMVAYMRRLQDAIDEVAEQATYARIARNMLRMGLSVEDVLASIPGLGREGLLSIGARLNAEIMLLSGHSAEDVARELGMTGMQVQIVERVLEVRGDAARGHPDEVLVKRHNVSDAVADLQILLVESALAPKWDIITGQGDLTALSLEALVPAAALARLRAEVAARGALWMGAEAGAVAQAHPELSAEDISALEAELPRLRQEAASSIAPPAQLAFDLRLPLDVLKAA